MMIMKIVEALLISTFVLVTGTLLLRLPASAQSTAFAQGDDGQPCHLLTSSSPIPRNWGAPFNTLSSSRELILSASCSSGGATISAGTGAPTQYIYENAYEYRDGAWHTFTYTGSQKAGPWLVGKGSATLSRTQAQLSQNSFFTAYVCIWSGSQWKCGCRDEACTQSYWQLQVFRHTGSTGSTASLSANPTSITSGNSSTLTWSSTNTTSCTGTGFSTGTAVSGSVSVSPTVNTTYSVSCTGAGGTANASAAVVVTGGSSTPTIVGCSGATVNVTSANIKSVLADHTNVNLVMAPGSYGAILSANMSNKVCVALRCSQPAVVDGAVNNNGCNVTSLGPWRIDTVIIENIIFIGAGSTFGGNTDYGIIINHADKFLARNNAFDGRYHHDISTKRRMDYTEILDNHFFESERHSIEVGQEPSRNCSGEADNTSDTMVVRGNIFANVIGNAITQKNNRTLIIENNQFNNIGGHTLRHWPLWRKWDCPATGAPLGTIDLFIPSAPRVLRTTMQNNTFTGRNAFYLESRGVKDDSVLIRENSGTVSSCKRLSMNADAQAAYGDEETTLPPKLDPASDVSC